MRICAVVPEKDAALPSHTQRTATLMRSSTVAINFTFGELGGLLGFSSSSSLILKLRQIQTLRSIPAYPISFDLPFSPLLPLIFTLQHQSNTPYMHIHTQTPSQSGTDTSQRVLLAEDILHIRPQDHHYWCTMWRRAGSISLSYPPWETGRGE